MNAPEHKHIAMLDELKRVFTDIQRDGGITLHETEVIDLYGSPDARKEARRKDTDGHWWEVRDEWITKFGDTGGLSFLDETAFRYYLPAYMSYWLRTEEEPNSLGFHLQDNGRWNFDSLFLQSEKVTI